MASEKKHDRSSSGSRTEFEHHATPSHTHNDTPTSSIEEADRDRRGASQKLSNPLQGLDRKRLAVMGEEYARLAGLTSDDDIRAFRIGATIAGDSIRYDNIPELTDREREVLERETTHKWSNPSLLYWMIVGT